MKPASIIATFLLILTTIASQAQNAENWTKDQLEEPAQLAQQLKDSKNVPIIISVGPGAVIPESIDVGSTKDSGNIAKLQTLLGTIKKDKSIVIYCGCCPFEHCPNVRPAISILQKNGYTNYKLLNIPHNIKTDWIDKGYPTSKL